MMTTVRNYAGGWYPFIPIAPTQRLPMQSPIAEDELVATYEAESKSVPFYVEPFIGYRSWAVEQRDDGMMWLRSVTYNVFWPMQEELHASCRHLKCEDSPNESTCGCGIYTVKELDAAKAWAHQSDGQFRVIGRVKIWGRIFQYEKGFIVEYAYPETVWVADDYSFWEKSVAKPDASPEEIAFMLEEAYKVTAEVGWPQND